MSRFIKSSKKKAGEAPGTLVHVGEKKAENICITLMDFDEQHLQEKQISSIEEAFPLRDLPTCTWINVDGLHDIGLMEKIGHHFGLHPLTLEDILNTGQRPKAEEYDDYIYLVIKMLAFEAEENAVRSEQVSLIVGQNFLISFQEIEGDVLAPVRERIRNGKGRIRKRGADYLAYAIMDAIVDHYFQILEKIGETIEVLEEELLEHPGPDTLQTIHELKREIIYIRKNIWPLRELINHLNKTESSLIQESTILFLRDVYDHTIQIIDTIESYRDILSGLTDLYLSTISNRMNEVMKVLTIIATIFIPITFVAGVYGMNFKYMPELDWKWGYFFALASMGLITAVMLIYFRRKHWL